MSDPIYPNNECRKCGGPIEWVKCKDPYWRHTDMSDLKNPHGAAPKF